MVTDFNSFFTEPDFSNTNNVKKPYKTNIPKNIPKGWHYPEPSRMYLKGVSEILSISG